MTKWQILDRRNDYRNYEHCQYLSCSLQCLILKAFCIIRGVVSSFSDLIFRARMECSYHTSRQRYYSQGIMGQCAESQLSVRLFCDATLAFIKRCNVLSAIIEMAEFREQRACIKILFQVRENCYRNKSPECVFCATKIIYFKNIQGGSNMTGTVYTFKQV